VPAPTVVGTPTASWNATAGNTITIAKPAGVQDGDYLVAFLRAQSATATGDWTRSGWTHISVPFLANQSGPRLIGIYGLAVPSAAALTDTSFTFTYPGGGSRVIGTIVVVRGVNLSSPVVAMSTPYGGTAVTGGAQVYGYTNSAGTNAIALALFSGELVQGNTNAITLGSSPATTVTTLFTNDTANDGTVGITGSRTALTAVSYPGVATLPDVTGTWPSITAAGAIGVVLRAASIAPVAAFTYSTAGLGISVDGSTSSDSDGTIASYAWNFGDSSSGTGVTTSHTYSADGTYTITLTVTDNSGTTHTTTHSVTVAGVSLAPTRVGYGVFNSFTSTTLTVSPTVISGGAAIATGHWMIASFGLLNTTTTITPPAGWTALKPLSASAGTLKHAVYARIRQAGDTSYDFALDANGNVSSAALMWGSGADPDISHWTVGATTGRTVDMHNTAVSLTTSYDHSLVLGLSFERTSAAEAGITSLTGANEWFYVPQNSTTHIQTIDVAYIADVTPVGATSVMEWIYPNTQALNGAALQIAIPPAPSSSTINVGYPAVLRTSGGVNYNGKMFYWDGSTAHDFSGTLQNAFKPVTVTQFMTQTPWFAAHRGFSNSYPEESLYSYRGATDWGIKAIEVSVQYSSEGTPWCFHDATTTRTTGVTGTISAMTDAQIGALTNLGTTASRNPTQPARPTAKLVDVLNIYAATHVIIIEDKTYTHTAAMLDMMDSYGTSGRPATEIFIVKAGVTSGSWLWTMVAARGYHRWGYMFDNEMDTIEAAASSGKVDMIGMDYASSDATLTNGINLCIANGVMPTGHIINSIAQRDRLLGLGMKGLMISNKDVVPPWYLP